MFLTLIQCLCFETKILYVYHNIVKGFVLSHSCNIHTNFKIWANFIHQSYHNLKNVILNTEKNLSVYNIKISLQIQLGHMN